MWAVQRPRTLTALLLLAVLGALGTVPVFWDRHECPLCAVKDCVPTDQHNLTTSKIPENDNRTANAVLTQEQGTGVSFPVSENGSSSRVLLAGITTKAKEDQNFTALEGPHENGSMSELPLIIGVTPTHNRAAQLFHMTQVATVLRIVPPPFLWIVVESLRKTNESTRILERVAGKCMKVGVAKQCTRINYIHISTDIQAEDPRVSRGVRQRNCALEYIQSNHLQGIVYFMDDDNAYTPELFEELRKVKRVGVLPVGMIWSWESQTLKGPNSQHAPFVERPLVMMNKDRKPRVYGWETFEWALVAPQKARRKYHLDMAGFAFHSKLLWEPTNNVTGRPMHPVRFVQKIMSLETLFLDKLVSDKRYLEPLADLCQDVWVWHVKYEARQHSSYPANCWRVPQPNRSELVLDKQPVMGISRYMVNGMRYSIRGYNLTFPAGYKSFGAGKPKGHGSRQKVHRTATQ